MPLAANGRYWFLYCKLFDRDYHGAHVVYYFPPSRKQESMSIWIVPNSIPSSVSESALRRQPATLIKELLCPSSLHSLEKSDT